MVLINSIEDAGIEVISAESSLIPDNYVSPDKGQQSTIQRMIDSFEDLDDVQEVYHNLELD